MNKHTFRITFIKLYQPVTLLTRIIVIKALFLITTFSINGPKRFLKSAPVFSASIKTHTTKTGSPKSLITLYLGNESKENPDHCSSLSARWIVWRLELWWAHFGGRGNTTHWWYSWNMLCLEQLTLYCPL